MTWDIKLSDKQGKVQKSAAYMTKMPENSRDSILQATLIAAATSQLGAMKAWLIETDNSKLKLSKTITSKSI